MADTLERVWRRVALRAPGVPPALVREFVQEAYLELCGRRRWVWLRSTVILRTQAARTVSVGVTTGSTTITSGAAFVAGDAGRQIRFGTETPIYTIDTVTDASTATLTEAYASSTGTGTGTISDIYLAMPSDFRSFDTVTNLADQRPVVWWISKEKLDDVDPARIQSDSHFRALVAAQISPAASLSGRLLYEAYPHPTAAQVYQMSYYRQASRLAETASLQGVLADRGDVIQEGALARVARWPGTEQRKNPYFNAGLADRHEAKFKEFIQTLDVQDDDQYLQNLLQVEFRHYGWLSGGAESLRSSDATLSDYY